MVQNKLERGSRNFVIFSILVLSFLMVFFSGCTQNENSVSTSTNSPISDKSNLTETSANVSVNVSGQRVTSNNSTKETETKQSDLDKLISGQIKSDSKSLLPTLDDFDFGWELEIDKAKNMSETSAENQARVYSRGYVEGHYRQFKKGGSNLAELGKIEYILFSISLYDKTHVAEVLADHKADIDKGFYTYNETYEDEEYNETTEEFENVTLVRETNVTYAQLKDPEIGDKSLMWSESEIAGFLGEIKKYHLAFVKKNVYVELTCSSFDTDKSINNCLNYAKFVEAKI